MARVRTFIAVEVGAGVRSCAVVLQQTLAKTGAEARWVEPENLHITLLFLGEVEERDLMTLCRAVSAAAATEPPFPLRVSGVGAFPTPRRPKTIWAGVTDGSAELIRLHTRLDAAMQEIGGYRSEERSYTPHLTLGRVRAEADGTLLATELPKHASWTGGQSVINELVLFTSELRREGPVYTAVCRATLGT